MKIALMLRHLGEKGGIVTYSRNLVEGFLRIAPQHDYHLMYRDPELLGTFGQHASVTEEVLPAPDKFVWDHWAVPRSATRHGLELIFNPKLSVPICARQPRVLVLRPEQFVHPELFKPLDRIYFKTFIPLFCRVAERVVAPTEQAVDDIVNFVGADRKKMVAVHEGCGEHFFAPAPSDEALAQVRERYQLPEEYVLFVGGITPLKNFERLVEAYWQVRQKRNIPLVVVGFNRWSFEKDLAFAKTHPAAKHIHFPGFVADEDMPHVYRLASALFFPSIYEGFGIPVPEAFATGCPVVTTKRGCSPEVAGGCAELVDPLDVADMARGLEKVLSEPAYRQELIEKGLARAPHFRFDRCARQTLDVFEQVV